MSEIDEFSDLLNHNIDYFHNHMIVKTC